MKNDGIKKVVFCKHCGADNIVSIGISVEATKILSSSSGTTVCWYCKKLFKWHIDWRKYGQK